MSLHSVVVLGFEQRSPGTARPNATCDIVAAVNDKRTFFEVKRKASEEKQTLPDLLEKELRKLESTLPFSMTPRLVDRDYDCSNLNEELHRIENHVAAFETKRDAGQLRGQNKPVPFEGRALSVVFHLKSERAVRSEYFFDPVQPSDLSKYLLGPGSKGKDGEPMVPMVLQALLKGAGYLMCRVTPWKGWPLIVEECFRWPTLIGEKTYFADDLRLATLNGIILFASYDDFCIVNNLRARARNWLRA